MSNTGVAAVAAADGEEVSGKAEMESPAAVVPEGTAKRKKRKQEVANAKENGTVEQEAASVAAAVLASERLPESKKKKKAKAKERVMAEQEATTSSVSALDETLKCKEEKAKERGMVEQGATTSSVSGVAKVLAAEVGEANRKAEMESAPAAVPEGTAKCKKRRKKRKQEVSNAKENGTVEQEPASVAAAGLASEGMPESKKKKPKAKERVMTEQEATTTPVSALDETPKCKEKAKERGMVEQGATTSSVSALEESEKYRIQGEKGNETDLAKQETAPAAVSASEGTMKHKKKKLKKKNKMQEQQESTKALSDLLAVDKIVDKPGNSGTDGEGTSGDSDVSMDPINAKDPKCSKAKDADDKVKCKAQEGNKNCSEKFSSLQEGSEDTETQRKRPKRKRKSRGPDITSQDGGRVARRCLNSSMDHVLSCICASCLVPTDKEKIKDVYSPRGSLIRFQRKKLLILDLNGLLADINMDKHNEHMAHAKVKGKLVFRRPYYDDFLNFCFQNFHLGIWSSRKMENVNSVIDILMHDLKKHLVFCWDMSKCTSTAWKVIDNKHKPLVLKQLKKLWDKDDPNLPWELGEFSPSNTLLVDDSPYKALGNPPHTAIFPQPYSYLNQRDDCSLGPGGDLRVYLERLAAADDVQVFVRDNPFGQPSITEGHPDWNFYVKIVNKLEMGLGMKWKTKQKQKKKAYK